MPTRDEVMERLRYCYDPEIDMTLTAQGCPSHVEIGRDIKRTVESMPGVNICKVNVVWDPPWTPHRISLEGRQKLGIDEDSLGPAPEA